MLLRESVYRVTVKIKYREFPHNCTFVIQSNVNYFQNPTKSSIATKCDNCDS